MPLDAVYLSAVAGELGERITGARIDKIHQPEHDEIILNLRGANGNFKLLISASANHPRVHLTEGRKENPDAPPKFCMLLRKHLQNSSVCGVTQPAMERVLIFEFDTRNELGERSKKSLIAELIGRQSNIILTDDENRIIDCVKRINSDTLEKRRVLPGLFYIKPPEQGKNSLLAVTNKEIKTLFDLTPEETGLYDWLLNTFDGLSPLICREILFRAAGTTQIRKNELDGEGEDKLLKTLFSAAELIREKKFGAYMLIKDGKASDFSYMPIYQYGDKTELIKKSGFSELLDHFYAERDMAERIRQRSQSMTKTIVNLRDRAARKLELQKKELEATYGRERLRELGDIVTANLHLMEKGMTRLLAVDFYSPGGEETEIELNPLYSPQQNAAKFYKDYTKAKNAEFFITEQIKKGEMELIYLNSVLEEIKLSEGESDLEEIRAELCETGYISRRKQKKNIKKSVPGPVCFKSSSGLLIRAGKNNVQNDELTMRSSQKSDVWLHTQKIHGSHVVISCEGGAPDDASLHEAAVIAAYYSQARESKKVPVDYTQIRNVKKAPGAKPGMVIYSKFETIIADPDPAVIEKLKI